MTISKLVQFRRISTTVMIQNIAQKKATVTVIIFTATYILYNIPIFLNYLIFATIVYDNSKYTDVFNTSILYWYSWNFTYVVCTALNSTTNPMIYVFRMKKFRRHFNNMGQNILRRCALLMGCRTNRQQGTFELVNTIDSDRNMKTGDLNCNAIQSTCN
jgi:hypothetical protein